MYRKNCIMAFSLQQLSTQMLLLPSTLAFASRSLHSRSPLLHHGGSLASTGAATNPAAASFIDRINNDYEGLHKSFEQQFWGTKMALASKDYSTEELTRTKREMEDFLASEEKLATTRQLLADGGLSDRDAMTLKLFERTFGCYIMESAEAREFRLEATKIEGDLESSRNNMALGAELPGQGYVEMSSVGLRSKMSVDSNEEVRKACWESLRGIGDFVLANGFIELVKARNAMAKALGYEDYYDYKVTQAEGFGKRDLFDILDKLEEDTRPLMEQARKDLQAIKGESALEPWNTGYLVAGDVTSKLDPYFPFEKSVEAWGRSFSALGIEYKGATMDLDLLDRKRKYSNGFCHWPQPAWRKSDGTWQPSVAHFTSLADPNMVGSGLTALTTLMHEAGHAAHFANIDMPSPLFSQERAPTSVPYAELQSMFLDSLVGDAAWRATYARNRAGEPLPWALHEEGMRATHPYKVLGLRNMISVSYFEKALYELPEDQLTSEAVTSLADKVEREIQGGLSGRPLLTVPHLISDEASCYYHGYVLAEMAVHQTRAFFLQRDGFLVDNPKIGPTLASEMWAPGNSQPFLGLVEKLTGKPLDGSAWVAALAKPIEKRVASEREAYDAAIATSKADAAGAEGKEAGEVDLAMRVRLVDGDAVIADTEESGSFLAACGKFEAYISGRFRAKA